MSDPTHVRDFTSDAIHSPARLVSRDVQTTPMVFRHASDRTRKAEEAEIVRLIAAHYRSLLDLRRLNDGQRQHIGWLLRKCETGAAGRDIAEALHCKTHRDRDHGAAAHRVHEEANCLTAIRMYAAGAQRALAAARPDAAAQALALIMQQVERAARLNAEMRLADEDV